jgi:hypothetical protein
MKRQLVALCLLFPLITLAQSQGDASQPPFPPPGPPPFALKTWVDVLLEHRQELALTSQQVAGMDRINKTLAEKDAPLKDALEQLRPPPPPGGMGRGMGGPMPGDARGGGDASANRPSQEEMRARFEQAHALMDQLKANDEAAYQEAEALLSDAQKATAQALVSAEETARQKHHQEMRQRMHERTGSGGSL